MSLAKALVCQGNPYEGRALKKGESRERTTVDRRIFINLRIRSTEKFWRGEYVQKKSGAEGAETKMGTQ